MLIIPVNLQNKKSIANGFFKSYINSYSGYYSHSYHSNDYTNLNLRIRSSISSLKDFRSCNDKHYTCNSICHWSKLTHDIIKDILE
jgi:hypothetical protein